MSDGRTLQASSFNNEVGSAACCCSIQSTPDRSKSQKPRTSDAAMVSMNGMFHHCNCLAHKLTRHGLAGCRRGHHTSERSA